MTDSGTYGSAFDSSLETLAIDVVRGLAMDAPHAARSGHQGTAMALAPLAHVLWTRILTYDAADPTWPDRDRFILSAGHASILLYSMLYLTGHGLTLDDIRAFRQWGSATPGHPEVGHTAGVEVTTGPLGQGLANGVGMAIAERNLRARFGSELTACGSSSVSLDDLILSADALPAGQFGIFYMGDGVSFTPFGDGNRCVGSAGAGLFRYPPSAADASGGITEGPGIINFGQSHFGTPGHIAPGDTWNFQAWYRDPSGPCGSGFNLSNGMAITFGN